MLALAPFATLAGWVGDPATFAAARVAFMLLGSLNAVLVGIVLRRLGLAAAVTGGAFYAVFFPAAYVEHTTLLEPWRRPACWQGRLGGRRSRRRNAPVPAPCAGWGVARGGMLAGIVAVCLPFYLAAPTAMWRRGGSPSGGCRCCSSPSPLGLLFTTPPWFLHYAAFGAGPLALVVGAFALLVPLIAGGLGLVNSFRMMRLPDLTPSSSAEQAGLG